MVNLAISIIILAIAICIGGYAIGGIAMMIHANRKFQDCAAKWRTAQQSNDKAGMTLYYRCEEIAHEDSWALGKSPMEWKRRWNADYEQEAQVKR